MNGTPWTEEEISYVREHYPTKATASIAAKLGRTVFMVNNQAYKMGLKKNAERMREVGFQKGSQIGEVFRFKPGQVPPNKGKKMPGWAPGRMRETQFKVGEMAGAARAKWKPIGTITPDSEGYLRIKLREREPGKEHGWNNNVWRLLHWHIWEQAHGPIPQGHVLVFKDGNRANCEIENLELIPRGELAARNRMWNVMPRELAEVIHLTGQLKRKLRGMEQKQANG